MTLPDERYRAVAQARDLLRKLVAQRRMPRNKKEWDQIREEARSALKHYPGDLYLDDAAKKAPEVFKKPVEHYGNCFAGRSGD
jgi:hypothetical protein